MKQQTHSEDTMETRQRKTTSGDSFSFPSTPNPDSDFEFGSLTTPDSPSSDQCITSPADHLFFNGRLQPHSFPLFHPPNHHHHHSIAVASRTSSISSKDSLMSSRSNSINSRGSSSCSSSARTSASDSSERRLLHSKLSSLSSSSPSSPSCKGVYMGKRTMVSAHHQVYGCSQRWQYITPVPALNRDASKKRTAKVKQKKKMKEEKKSTKKIKKNNNMEKKKTKVRLRFGRKILRWFVMACRECHAMEPSKIKKKKHIMSQENVNT
ncbi:hypothetical protein PIB30_087320 [Stylosanthes scabra]|uniref:Uncharacterized protein n=1 Tax=Stylosanthes scabra TaxID=79078 RepID=A0ABU6XR37_9FABA|nr:hypothetical protein [Stylosanthes scabra]